MMKKRSLGQQFLLTQLRGMMIFDRHDLRPVGIIEGLIFRSENLQVAFLQCLVGGGIHFVRSDQTAVVENVLTVQDLECFGNKEDFLRDELTFREDCRLLGYKVCSIDGTILGKVEDCSVKLPLMMADRLYIRRPLMKSLQQSSTIIPTSAIHDLQPEKKLIFVQTEFLASKKTAIKPMTA